MDLESPFPYQEAGAQWLSAQQQALLADSMGLGKSAQVVMAADLTGASRILILCPAAVRINWAREFARFSPFDHETSVIFTGRDRISDVGVVICSYDLAHNDRIRKQLMAQPWDLLVLDECHFLKSRTARRTKVAYGHGSRSPGLISKARRTWRLSGTPAPNFADELWTHLKSANLTDLSYWDFVARYCKGFDSGFGFKITGHQNVEELKQLLSRFMLRRKKEDVMKDLPPITFQEVTVERGEVDIDIVFFEQLRRNFRDDKKALFASIKESDDALRAALSVINKTHAPAINGIEFLRGMNNESTISLRRYIGMAKLPAVGDIIEAELESKEIDKIVIFAIHKDVIEGLRQRFAKKYGAVTLYGGTAPVTRQRNIDRFMNDPKCRVFVGNITAAGTGITLTSACEVAFIEADWVPGNNAQAAMRCHRIGQARPVRVRFFSCADSSDEDVMRILRHKTREQVRLFD